jgi:molybdenum cofactor synthesis domain-containing protein
MTDPLITAAVLVIGDEVLSGRTKDTNSGYIADYLSALGIDLKEIRVVGDEQADIVAALNALRARYVYVFTCGGIGPTHDDITADAVGAAFGLEVKHDPRAMAILAARYAKMEGVEFNEARQRMARMPVGADLINNPVTDAPGFRVENVHVMAGVPKVMQAMMDSIAPTLKANAKVIARSIDTGVKEGDLAGFLGDLQKQYPTVLMGSYPYMLDDASFGTKVAMRSRDLALIDEAEAKLKAWLKTMVG